MRLFLAIELSEEARDHLVRVQDALRRDVRSGGFTKAANLHLTLKFLGEAEDSAIKPLCDDLAAMRSGAEIQLRADHLVCLPERGPIRILAAGAIASPALLELVERIEGACEAHGFPRERRRFLPHITFARLRNPLPGSIRSKLFAAAESLWPGPGLSTRHFTLMESRLLAQGAEYHRAAELVI